MSSRQYSVTPELSVRKQRRAEFAGGEGMEGAEALPEFGGGQAAVTVEPAKEIGRGRCAFAGIALETAGDEVAVGVASPTDLRDDMIENLNAGSEATQAVEARAALADVDGLAERGAAVEVELLEIDRRRNAAVVRVAG